MFRALVSRFAHHHGGDWWQRFGNPTMTKQNQTTGSCTL